MATTDVTTLISDSGERIGVGLAVLPFKSEVHYGLEGGHGETETGRYAVFAELVATDKDETWGAGINYNFGRKLMVEFDYTYQPWSKVKFRGFDGESTEADAWRLCCVPFRRVCPKLVDFALAEPHLVEVDSDSHVEVDTPGTRW